MKKQNKLKKSLCRVSAFLLVLVVLVSAFGMTASADQISTVPYDTYTYWTAPGVKNAVSSTPMYELDRIITGADLGISAMKEPKDVFTDAKGLIYIMDSGNGRVIVLNPDFTLKTIIEKLSYKGEELSFVGAGSVFVTKNQKIYIADTEGGRVIITNLNSEVSDILTLPEDDIIPENFTYRPSKIAIDSNGYTYILSEGSYYGALLYKPNGEFSGFFGSNTVETSILGVFERIYELFFVSETKMAARVSALPFSFTDITVDNQDFIYTATGATSLTVSNTGQLRKLSPSGINILKDKTHTKVTGADGTNFSDGIGIKYPNFEGYYAWRVTDLCTMDVDNDGYMYGYCRNFGHVFIYDQGCNLLSVFGGGTMDGDQEGRFARGNAIQYNDVTGDILIVDYTNLNLTVYKETEYGKHVKAAQVLTNAGSYSEAKPHWEEALKYDRNSQLAYRGLARAALVEENYELCLEYAKLGYDQDTYASAYKFVRNEWLTNNFVWLFLIVAVFVGGIIFLLVYTNKHKVKLIKNVKVATMFGSIMHPFDGASQIRYYNNGSTLLATGCMVLFFLSSVISDMNYGFMYNIFDKSSYNIFFPILKNFGIVLLWVIANWGMSTLFEGKGRIKDVYIVTCYALIPLIANNLILTALSNFITPEEALVMNAVNFVCTALALIMLSIGTMTVHEFGFFKFLVMTLIVIIAMLVVVFVILMIFVLIQQLSSFVSTLYKEVSYR